ncbi:JAB domain-containing protein [Tenacibaculum maritimum]|uniref:JAB domain-containing protein n=1 Tax=Tenacibaculum maritimum TaxID=107401 RepID=UPI00293BAA3D|nr:JAB domain-containing protein [Tenacibaculum maritimum]
MNPSEVDKTFTDRLLKVGKLINIEVVDHLIISEEKYTSLTDNGVIKELQNFGGFEIIDKEKKDLEE